ncbi:hypothetical protein CIP107517_00693 [Corynebacterium diphtheriae]|nr:hypothetical protein CIP107517_00693 [Corynebacterium diphtheriae]
MGRKAGSATDRFSDDLTPANFDGPPSNLPMLLDSLGVSGEPDVSQITAVRNWLKTNTPRGLLSMQLKRYGFV